MQFDLMVGQVLQIGTVRHALDRGLVDAILDHRCLEHGAGHDRLPDQYMLPGDGQPTRIQANARLMQECRAVIAATDVVFAGPHRLHRRACGLGHLHRFGNKIRSRIGAAAKATSKELGMNLHLLGLQPGNFPGDHLVQRLKLGARPDLALVLGDFHRAIERFHRCVGQVRHAVFDIDGFRRLGQGGLGIPGLAGRQARGAGQLAETLQQLLAVQASVRPQVPVNLECIASQLRRPIVIGDHRHSAGHLHHFVHARYRQCLGAFKRFDVATEHRRASNHGGHQPFELHIHAEPGPAGDFLRRVQALGGFADQLPVLGLLELDRGRVRHRQLAGFIGQFTVGDPIICGDDHPRFGTDRRGRDIEALGRRVDQHQARRRTRLAVAIELHPGGGRAAGDLHPAEAGQTIIGGRRRGMFDEDFRPVGVQLLGNQHGQAGPDTLAHFRVPEQHGDAVVVADSQERIRCEYIALILRALGEAVSTGDDKGHHQPAAKHGTALEKPPTRQWMTAVHDLPSPQINRCRLRV